MSHDNYRQDRGGSCGDAPRIQWPAHWRNGGTGVTKFDAASKPIYEAALAEAKDATMFLQGNELHALDMPRNLGTFWETYYRLKAEADSAAAATQTAKEVRDDETRH